MAMLVVALALPLTALGKPDEVTICHAAGLQGSDQSVTLSIAYPAAFGNGGHLNEDGTAQAGHEGDHLGPCVEETTTTSASPVTTAAEEQETTTTSASPVTTVAEEQETTTTSASPVTTAAEEQETTTTSASPVTTAAEEQETTTTTHAPETTTTEGGIAVESAVETTSTTAGFENTTTTTVDPDFVAASSDSDSDDGNEDPVASGGDEPALVGAAAGEDVDALPFTGLPTHLVFPASLMLLAGAVFVLVTSGFSQTAGAHVAIDGDRFGLGLHRGRHETLGS
jgi:hypothetical protein